MKIVPIAVLCGALAVSACASVPPPTDKLAVARSLVSEAQLAGATQYAPLELQHARDKLAQADKAMGQEQYARAGSLAEEAQVDAQLSLTSARAAKARRAAAKIEQSNRMLGQELEQRH